MVRLLQTTLWVWRLFYHGFINFEVVDKLVAIFVFETLQKAV